MYAAAKTRGKIGSKQPAVAIVNNVLEGFDKEYPEGINSLF